jgi:hypothetical protein
MIMLTLECLTELLGTAEYNLEINTLTNNV